MSTRHFLEIIGILVGIVGIIVGLFQLLSSGSPPPDHVPVQLVSAKNEQAAKAEKSTTNGPTGVVGLVQKSSAKFPDDLAPVLRGQGVAQAQEYKAAATNRLVFLNKDGNLNEWHEKIYDEWRADTVEKTELVVVLGEQYQTAIAKQTYVDRFGKPAPPITRYQFGLDVAVHAARSGSLLASKRFVTQPPEFRKNVDYRVTALGQPVTCADVFGWVTTLAQAGFGR